MKRLAYLLLPSLILLALVILPSSVVFAQNESSDTQKENLEAQKERLEAKKEELKEKIATRTALRKEKLEEVKQKVCETKKKNIIRRSNAIATRAEKQFNVFGNIEARVDNYYTGKLVPKGIILVNYDALKADIQDKKAAAQAAIEAAKSSASGFDCSGDDPKGQLATFRENMKEAIAALKEYRTSIKNFIVAIRTAKSNAEATASATENGGND